MRNSWIVGSSLGALVLALLSAVVLLRGGPERVSASVPPPATLTAVPPALAQPQTTPAASSSDGKSRPYQSRIIVWDGDHRTGGYGWSTDDGSMRAQQVETHSGRTAMEFHAMSRQYVVSGWNWIGSVAGPGTDVSRMTRITFWAKLSGEELPLQLHMNLRSSTNDPARHQTAKIDLLEYFPQLRDGQWHEIVVPLEELYQQSSEFEPETAREIQFGVYSPEDQLRRFSFYVDDVAFDDAPAEP